MSTEKKQKVNEVLNLFTTMDISKTDIIVSEFNKLNNPDKNIFLNLFFEKSKSSNVSINKKIFLDILIRSYELKKDIESEKELEKIAISALNKYTKWLQEEKEKRELELKEKIIKLQIR